MTNLWDEYRKNGSSAAKEQLILHYAPLVKFVAGRLMVHIGQNVEFDDLVGYGIFGLIDAIEKFDHTKGVKFETYASFRVRGTIIDNIRRMDWVPRSLRQKHKQVENAITKLEDELGRSPTDEELSEELGLGLDETGELLRKASIHSLVSLDDFLDQHYEKSHVALVTNDSDSPEAQTEERERKHKLAETIDSLKEKEKLVITLYYYEGLTLKEISSIMNVTESRVSQIHTKAISRLQVKLGRYKNLLFQ